MFYNNELQFFCDTLKKNHIGVSFASLGDPLIKIFGKSFEPMFTSIDPEGMTVGNFLPVLEPNIVYKMTDSFSFSYIYFLLPEMPSKTVFFIGPYIHSQFSHVQLLEIGEKNGIQPKNQSIFEKFFQSFPVITGENPIFSMLEVLGERIWGRSAFTMVDVNKENSTPASPIIDEFDDVLVNMKNMEMRYECENEMIEAVKLGQLHKAGSLLSKFSAQDFEMRAADPLRNMKNYCIIMNTLLRKAAENGGVHPIYLDSVSSGFAKKIEQFSSVGETPDMMMEMFRAYCRLVRKHSINEYSPLVQKVIVMIDSNISANLALSSLAAEQKVSPGYLSTVFKKETGKSITEYIREKRIKHAAHLLATTHLQIQTVALHCGIMDVQYFSKIFKKEMGKPPKEYRDGIKKN